MKGSLGYPFFVTIKFPPNSVIKPFFTPIISHFFSVFDFFEKKWLILLENLTVLSSFVLYSLAP